MWLPHSVRLFLGVPAASFGFLLDGAVGVALQMVGWEHDDFLMPSAGALLLLIDDYGVLLLMLRFSFPTQL